MFLVYVYYLICGCIGTDLFRYTAAPGPCPVHRRIIYYAPRVTIRPDLSGHIRTFWSTVRTFDSWTEHPNKCYLTLTLREIARISKSEFSMK